MADEESRLTAALTSSAARFFVVPPRGTPQNDIASPSARSPTPASGAVRPYNSTERPVSMDSFSASTRRMEKALDSGSTIAGSSLFSTQRTK